jgi:hypothetical protein
MAVAVFRNHFVGIFILLPAIGAQSACFIAHRLNLSAACRARSD